ncbi:MAG: phospholipase D-like domain-containing protein [Elusimicrobiota bacterium]|jgi:phosphatidylserine/phosphatidylglycerophosphate/cardiolipin synthase-like enzyme
MISLASSFRVTLLLLLATASWASPTAYFSSEDDLQSRIVKTLDRCQTSLEIALYEFSSPRLTQAVERAAERGVFVRVLLDATPSRTSVKNNRFPNLEVRYLQGRRAGAMHHKFAVLDNQELMTGSFNWTRAAQYMNHENIIFEDDGGIVLAYSRQFEDLWRQARHRPASFHHRREPVRHE